MMTSVVSSFFPNKHVREGGETVKARLSKAWNLPVQVPAAPLPGAPAWSKDLSHFDLTKTCLGRSQQRKL